MALKYYKPTTPGQRSRVSVDLSHLQSPKEVKAWKKLKKSLHRGKKKTGGRNHHGRISIRHRGGGHKQSYRQVLFRRKLLEDLINLVEGQSQEKRMAQVEALLYDPNRSAHLALISYSPTQRIDLRAEEIQKLAKKAGIVLQEDQIFFYILAAKNLQQGGEIPLRSFQRKSSPMGEEPLQLGEALAIEESPLGALLHNIEIHKGKGGQLARAAGSYGQLIEKAPEKRMARVRMPSGEERWLHYGSFVSYGSVGNEDHRQVVLAKAGRKRWLSRRPSVRGVAMNPVDHPHGGGEGRTSGGRPSVSPWGRPTRNFRLRKKGRNPFAVRNK